MIALFERYGLALVFGNVLLEQVGVPVPAIPTLIVAGALAAEGQFSAWAVFALAFVACAIGDALWYVAGRLYGHRVMKLLCSISLSPDSCVRQTESTFERWGGLTLVLGKFIPGLSTVAPPLAGAMRLGWPTFLLLNSIGAALWAWASIGAGMLFHAEVSGLILRLQDLGAAAVALAGALLATYVALKWWERKRFYKTLRMARVTVDELRKLMHGELKPVIVDLRSHLGLAADRRSIPGAIAIALSELDQKLALLPRDREIIFFCNCPNEESAASAAKALIDRGYTRVRPLLGGVDAWIAAGFELERLA